MREESVLVDRTCLVTGGSGLLGGHLTEALLQRGARVVLLIRDRRSRTYLETSGALDKCIQVYGDLSDIQRLRRIGHKYDVQYVFHLAAQTQVGNAHRDPVETFESNLRGQWLLLEAARTWSDLKGVYLSSSDKAYGQSDSLPHREDHVLNPLHPYDVSKAAGEMIARSYHASYGLPLLITRCGNLYGPGDLNWDRLIPSTIRAVARGARPVIRSDGSPLRDYVFVREAVRGILDLVEAGAWSGDTFNIGARRPSAVIDVVETVQEVMGRGEDSPIILGQANDELQAQHLCSTLVADKVGWVQQVGLVEGLVETIPWYETYWT